MEMVFPGCGLEMVGVYNEGAQKCLTGVSAFKNECLYVVTTRKTRRVFKKIKLKYIGQ